MNSLNNFDKTDSEYSLAHTDDLITFRRSKDEVTADVKVKSCKHHISWTAWAVSVKLMGN